MTRTAKRMGTKTKNNRKDPNNIWFHHKVAVSFNGVPKSEGGRRNKRRMNKSLKSQIAFHKAEVRSHPNDCYCFDHDPTGFLYSESMKRDARA